MRRQLHRIGPGRDLEGVEEPERDGHGRLGAGQVLEVRQRNEGALFPGRASRALDVTVWVAGPVLECPARHGVPGDQALHSREREMPEVPVDHFLAQVDLMIVGRAVVGAPLERSVVGQRQAAEDQQVEGIEILRPHLEGRDGKRGEMRMEIAADVTPRAQVGPATQAERPGAPGLSGAPPDTCSTSGRVSSPRRISIVAPPAGSVDAERAIDVAPVFAELPDVLGLARDGHGRAVRVRDRHARGQWRPGGVVHDARRERPGGGREGAGVRQTEPGRDAKTESEQSQDEQSQDERLTPTDNDIHDGAPSATFANRDSKPNGTSPVGTFTDVSTRDAMV